MIIYESNTVTLPKPIACEATDSKLPKVLFTEIHAITANWITRNKTYYPSESLIGDPNKGNGAISFFYPYPVPVIRDHNAGGGLFGEASLPYGRVYNANFIHDARSGGGWLKTIAAITDSFAIESILSGRFLTVSIGSRVDSIKCSICDTDIVADGLCDHEKGQTYEDKECYWKMGPIEAFEISFVNVPSDINAGVITPDVPVSEAKVLLANCGADRMFDLATGEDQPTESYVSKDLRLSKESYKHIMESAIKRFDYIEGLQKRVRM